MPIDLAQYRVDEYSFGSSSFSENVLDYKQGDYDKFRAIIAGDASTGIQLGALFAQDIILWTTAFEIGILPTVVVKEPGGKYDEELSAFANKFLRDQHANLLEAVETKNSIGDAYIAFNLDRNVESIDPSTVDAGFLPYSNSLASVQVNQSRYVRNVKTGRKNKMKILRTYSDKTVEYEAKLDSSTQYTEGIKVPEKLKLTNPLGICPVLLLPNLKKTGYAFGWSDIHWAVPLFELFHKTFIRGFESQQYSGKPILQISGIKGSVENWIQQTFKVDSTSDGTDATNSVVIDWFKRHRMLCLAEDTKAEFIESKMPIGMTLEILDQIIKHISRVTSIPEFIFGHNISSSDAAVREQYTALRAKTVLKQAKLAPFLTTLIRWAMVWYSTYDKNLETGEVYETVGQVSTLEDANKYTVDLIWPEMFGSDGKIKLEALTVLAQAGAVSRLGLMRNMQQYIPNPESELNQLEDEQERFGAVGDIKQTAEMKNSEERDRKDPNSQGNEDDTPESSRDR